MVHFAPLDWLWMSLFLPFMIGCGVLFYRLGKRSESDFFLAGRFPAMTIALIGEFGMGTFIDWYSEAQRMVGNSFARGYLTAWIANLGLSWIVVWILPMFGVIQDLPDYLQFWALMFLTAFIYLSITYLTKPEKMDRLVKYYVMSMTIGFWGIVRREVEKQGFLEKVTRIE